MKIQQYWEEGEKEREGKGERWGYLSPTVLSVNASNMSAWDVYLYWTDLASTVEKGSEPTFTKRQRNKNKTSQIETSKYMYNYRNCKNTKCNFQYQSLIIRPFQSIIALTNPVLLCNVIICYSPVLVWFSRTSWNRSSEHIDSSEGCRRLESTKEAASWQLLLLSLARSIASIWRRWLRRRQRERWMARLLPMSLRAPHTSSYSVAMVTLLAPPTC